MKKQNKEFVFLVGDNGPEHNEISSVHKTYPKAFKAWGELRLGLLNEAKKGLQYSKDNAKKRLKEFKRSKENKPSSQDTLDYYNKVAKYGEEMYVRMIKHLSCTDPKKINNYPHNTPYIEKHEVQD